MSITKYLFICVQFWSSCGKKLVRILTGISLNLGNIESTSLKHWVFEHGMSVKLGFLYYLSQKASNFLHKILEYVLCKIFTGTRKYFFFWLLAVWLSYVYIWFSLCLSCLEFTKLYESAVWCLSTLFLFFCACLFLFLFFCYCVLEITFKRTIEAREIIILTQGEHIFPCISQLVLVVNVPLYIIGTTKCFQFL